MRFTQFFLGSLITQTRRTEFLLRVLNRLYLALTFDDAIKSLFQFPNITSDRYVTKQDEEIIQVHLVCKLL